MPTQLSENLLAWGVGDIDPKAIEQAHRTSRMPFVAGHIALMPDAHYGLGSTIGSVIPTEGAIMPAAVGVDIGCGMIAVETGLSDSDLPDDLSGLLSSIEHAVPAGVGRGHGKGHTRSAERWWVENANPSVSDDPKLVRKAIEQYGTLGSGNHFVEVCLDPGKRVWVVLHSGSRGVGNLLARRHIDRAKGLMKERLVSLEDRDLAYLVEGEPEFQAYVHDLLWAQEYARANREAMMEAILARLRRVVSKPVEELRRINCHHNYAAREIHDGKTLWVTRKGAIRARAGDWGVIPGSMGTNTFVVRGLGNKESFDSSAHGAGRTMSRKQAKRTLSVESLDEAMGDRAWLASKARALVDEHPAAYKDIERVMRDQADLVEVEVELHQILNYKGT